MVWLATGNKADWRQLAWKKGLQFKIFPWAQLILGLCLTSQGYPRITGVEEVDKMWNWIDDDGYQSEWFRSESYLGQQAAIHRQSRAGHLELFMPTVGSVKFSSAPESTSAWRGREIVLQQSEVGSRKWESVELSRTGCNEKALIATVNTLTRLTSLQPLLWCQTGSNQLHLLLQWSWNWNWG